MYRCAAVHHDITTGAADLKLSAREGSKTLLFSLALLFNKDPRKAYFMTDILPFNVKYEETSYCASTLNVNTLTSEETLLLLICCHGPNC